MILRDLPPVGGQAIWSAPDSPPSFTGYRSTFVDSGTSALALAIIGARACRASVFAEAGQRGEPLEVILPAYGCPDLVAATVYAGCKPVLVDIASEVDPGYCLERLAEAINPNTVAVVAVNFMGIRDRIAAIHPLLPQGAYVIEDNAQWYPELTEGTQLTADFTVNSFGRGKPATLLGGGMLLTRTELWEWVESGVAMHIQPSRSSAGVKHRLKGAAYNILLNPYLYFWLNRNPLLKLGATHYDALEDITGLAPSEVDRIAASVRRYLRHEPWVQQRLDAYIESQSRFISPALSDVDRRKRLLRYPLLAEDGAQAARLCEAMKSLGGTRMYRRPLIEINGVAQDVKAVGGNQNAAKLAQCLLTLPVHSGVTEKDVTRMVQYINACV